MEIDRIKLHDSDIEYHYNTAINQIKSKYDCEIETIYQYDSKIKCDLINENVDITLNFIVKVNEINYDASCDEMYQDGSKIEYSITLNEVLLFVDGEEISINDIELNQKWFDSME